MFDVDAFTPVINLPRPAILGVGRIAPQWVYRPRAPLACAAADAHAQPGLRPSGRGCAPAARFLQYIKNLSKNRTCAGRLRQRCGRRFHHRPALASEVCELRKPECGGSPLNRRQRQVIAFSLDISRYRCIILIVQESRDSRTGPWRSWLFSSVRPGGRESRLRASFGLGNHRILTAG